MKYSKNEKCLHFLAVEKHKMSLVLFENSFDILVMDSVHVCHGMPQLQVGTAWLENDVENDGKYYQRDFVTCGIIVRVIWSCMGYYLENSTSSAHFQRVGYCFLHTSIQS